MKKRENKTQFIQFRVTPTEAVAIKRFAKERGIKISALIRAALTAYGVKHERTN